MLPVTNMVFNYPAEPSCYFHVQDILNSGQHAIKEENILYLEIKFSLKDNVDSWLLLTRLTSLDCELYDYCFKSLKCEMICFSLLANWSTYVLVCYNLIFVIIWLLCIYLHHLSMYMYLCIYVCVSMYLSISLPFKAFLYMEDLKRSFQWSA